MNRDDFTREDLIEILESLEPLMSMLADMIYGEDKPEFITVDEITNGVKGVLFGQQSNNLH